MKSSVFLLLAAILSASAPAFSTEKDAPKTPGKLVEVGGHAMHFLCTGAGSPTVVVEYGLGDVSTDWALVQSRVGKFTRVCTYDRAGYAWSEPGPMPRTYTQLNLELHEGLKKLNERFPVVLVGHSFGGGVIRSYAAKYPDEVAGLVLVDIVQEEQRIPIGDKAVRLRDFATGRPIPEPRVQIRADEKHAASESGSRDYSKDPIEPPLDKLSLEDQKIHMWANAQPSLEAAENSQRDWSPEFLALMHSTAQRNNLGSLPTLVLTHAVGGYPDNLDVPAADLDRERLACQKELTHLSTNSSQRIVASGHQMNLEAPDEVAKAIREVVDAVRNHTTLKP